MITSLDPIERKISLSVKSLEAEQTREDLAKVRSSQPVPATAMAAAFAQAAKTDDEEEGGGELGEASVDDAPVDDAPAEGVGRDRRGLSNPVQTNENPRAAAGGRRGRLLLIVVVLLVSVSSFVLFAFILGIMRGDSGTGLVSGDRVAVLEMRGVIHEFRVRSSERLDTFRKDNAIKAVVLRIDSPGGSVAPSQEIYEAVEKLDETKPVIASFGSTAASGGYYVALGARKIVSNPGTLTGSIGVILESANYGQFAREVGCAHDGHQEWQV